MQIHKDFLNEFSHACVWGRSVKFNPQRVGINHVLADEDVIQLYKKAGTKKDKNDKWFKFDFKVKLQYNSRTYELLLNIFS